MKRLAVVALLAGTTVTLAGAGDLTSGLHWFGRSAFRIDGPPVVYLDPFRLRDGLPKADIILITHAHFDHCSPADVALLPVGGTYTMEAAEAARAARAIKPRVAVPMHYGSVVGSDADARRFAALLAGSGVAAVVMAKE